MACCVDEGLQYNYNSNVTSGQTGFNVYFEELKYRSWNGVHYTEAANGPMQFLTSKKLSTVSDKCFSQ
ncbi:hypothetical protein ACB098_05G023300 [Castanea mollissima]